MRTKGYTRTHSRRAGGESFNKKSGGEVTSWASGRPFAGNESRHPTLQPTAEDAPAMVPYVSGGLDRALTEEGLEHHLSQGEPGGVRGSTLEGRQQASRGPPALTLPGRQAAGERGGNPQVTAQGV